MKLAEHVDQAPATDLGQGSSFVGMAHHLVAPGLGIVNIPILGRDVDIAAKNQWLAGLGVGSQPRAPAR